MSPMHKSITALAASALLATVGFATAQSTDANGATTTTTTTVDTATQVIPAQPTGVVELAKPKNTVTPTTKQADGPMGMENNLMTTGVIGGIVRPSIGDHATPPIQPDDQTIAVTKETTTTTVVTPPTPAPEPVAAPVAEPMPAPAAEPAPEPMPAPKADRN
jgi:outer membrane biosynthesis protein TonB